MNPTIKKYIPEIIENTEVFDTNPPMFGTTYKCPHCGELVEVKEIRRKSYKEGYEQGKFDKSMENSNANMMATTLGDNEED